MAATAAELKSNALNDFAESLVRSSAGGHVAKVITFGSVATGTARPDSDIDVLVVAAGRTKPVERAAKRVAERVFDQTGEWVEVHAYPVGDWLLPRSLFMLEARKGKEVFSMDEAAIRKGEAQKYIGLAMVYRETAADLLDSGVPRVAADVGHNAVELVLKALLLLANESPPRSHREAINRFLLTWRDSDRLPRGMARRLHGCLDTRNRARYDPEASARLADTVIGLLENELAREEGESDDPDDGREPDGRGSST